jgi:hypothetical protein
VRNFIGAPLRDLVKPVRKTAPDYMAMGSSGMAEMGEMEMQGPDNTLPMMTGFGQFGPMEMGGMFTVVKVREGLARGDYKDPGWYKHPEGSVAHEVASAEAPPSPRNAPAASGKPKIEMNVVKPKGGHKGQH